MANLNSMHHAQRLSQGNIRLLAYHVFGLEILARFIVIGQYRGYVHRKPLLKRAKAVDFPLTDIITPIYHMPGTQILGDNFPIETISISPDQLMVSSVSVPWGEQEIGDFLYSPKGSANMELVSAMAKGYGLVDDMQISVMLTRAARGHYERISNIPVDRRRFGASGYGNINRVDVGAQTAAGSANLNSYVPNLKLDAPVSAQDFVDKLAQIRTLITVRDLPQEDWVCFVDPAIYSLLWNDSRFSGNIERGTIQYYGGFSIHPISRLPSIRYLNLPTVPPAAGGRLQYDTTPPIHSGVDLERNKYWIENPQCTAALVFHREAVARLDVLNVAHETQWHHMYQSNLSTTTSMFGGGTKRGELAFEIAYSRPSINPVELTADLANYAAGYNDAP
jgi:hypothetical protein